MDTKRLFIATVYLSLPQLGIALVQNVNAGARYVLATLPMQDSSILGAYPAGAITVGSQVLCYKSYGNNAQICHILCVFNRALTPATNAYLWRQHNPVSELCMYDEHSEYLLTALRAYMNSDVDKLVHDYSHGADCDLLPGDYDIFDKESNTVGLHIGLYLAQLRASALASFEVSSINNQARIIGATIKEDTPVSEIVTCEDFAVSNYAVSIQEAFGQAYETVTTEDAENETLIEKELPLNALPLYRFQHIISPIIEGQENIIVGFPEKTDDWEYDDVWHNRMLEPPVLAKQRSALDGTLSELSAQRIISAKTPYISAIQQVGYRGTSYNKADLKDMLADWEMTAEGEITYTGESEQKAKDFTELREPYKPEKNEEEEKEVKEPGEEEAIDDAVINRVIKKLLSDEYSETLKAALSTKGLAVSNPDKALLNKDSLSALEGYNVDGDLLCSGPTSASKYPLPAKTEITDPKTNKTTSYYDSMSFISQEPDGSICLCDGYGSEIRMSRGNIYISPALDLFIRTGRDFSVMAGRHQAYNSQDTCTIHASTSTYIRAETDLKLSGGTADENKVATVMLENRSPQGSIDFKSNASITLSAAKDIYIGRRNQSAADNASSLTESEQQGTILIDSGSKGSCYIKGFACTLDASDLVLCSMLPNTEDFKGSYLHLDAYNLTACVSNIQLTGTLLLRKTAETDAAVIKIIRNGQMRDASIINAGSSDNPNVYIGGTVVVQKDLEVNGMGLFKGVDRQCGLAANGLISQILGRIGSQCIVLPYDDKLQPEELKAFKERIDITDFEIKSAINNNGSMFASSSVVRTCNDTRLNDIEFAYPDYNVYMNTMPGMMWQVRTKLYHRQDNLKYWTEPSLMPIAEGAQEPTACYPGYDNWQNMTVTDRGYQSTLLSADGYPLNVVK